jgi:hypothetical protein
MYVYRNLSIRAGELCKRLAFHGEKAQIFVSVQRYVCVALITFDDCRKHHDFIQKLWVTQFTDWINWSDPYHRLSRTMFKRILEFPFPPRQNKNMLATFAVKIWFVLEYGGNFVLNFIYMNHNRCFDLDFEHIGQNSFWEQTKIIADHYKFYIIEANLKLFGFFHLSILFLI